MSRCFRQRFFPLSIFFTKNAILPSFEPNQFRILWLNVANGTSSKSFVFRLYARRIYSMLLWQFFLSCLPIKSKWNFRIAQRFPLICRFLGNEISIWLHCHQHWISRSTKNNFRKQIFVGCKEKMPFLQSQHETCVHINYKLRIVILYVVDFLLCRIVNIISFISLSLTLLSFIHQHKL